MDSVAISAADTLPHWLGLVMTPGLGLRGAHKLLEVYSVAPAVYEASLTELEGCGIAPGAAQSLQDGRSLDLGAREAEQARMQGITVLSMVDRRYPELLREIYDPPIVLYVRGRVEALDTFGIAAVGTRRPTIYGRLMAEKLGAGLAAWGLTVISGLARGIDTISHQGCLGAGGVAVAVEGTGVDLVYPRENQKLAESILAAQGALVSEFPLGTFAAAQNFPIRNRIISGMAVGVLVVEGGEFSGSRITARMALEQNREVFAVPGMATQTQAWLPNTLIKQGAKLVTAVEDVIDDLPSSVRARLNPPEGAVAGAGAANGGGGGISPQHRAVLGAIQVDEASHVDEIGERLENKLTAPELLALLFDLELAGKVRQLPGKQYLKVG